MEDSELFCRPLSPLLNRSASFSEMSSRKKIILEEHLLSSSGHTLFRHYSCEQVSFSPSNSNAKIGIIRQFVSEIYLPDITNKCNILHFKNDTDEVSTIKHANSKNNLDVTLLPITYKDDTERKTCSHESVTLYKASMKWFLWLFIPLLCICLGMLATQSVLYQKTCQMNFNLDELQKNMNSKIFGQQNAITMIVSVFQTFYSNSKPGVQVLLITGGTGVGKSYAVSILEEHFPWQENIHHWIMPINSAEMASRSYDKFSSCGDNLIIVDSLSQQNIDETTELAKFLMFNNSHKRVIVIFIFSIKNHVLEDDSQPSIEQDLQLKFHNTGINLKIIPFKFLEEQHVVLCIKDSMLRKGIHLSNDALNFVLKNIFLEEGCKRVTSKVSLISATENQMK